MDEDSFTVTMAKEENAKQLRLQLNNQQSIRYLIRDGWMITEIEIMKRQCNPRKRSDAHRLLDFLMFWQSELEPFHIKIIARSKLDKTFLSLLCDVIDVCAKLTSLSLYLDDTGLESLKEMRPTELFLDELRITHKNEVKGFSQNAMAMFMLFFVERMPTINHLIMPGYPLESIALMQRSLIKNGHTLFGTSRHSPGAPVRFRHQLIKNNRSKQQLAVLKNYAPQVMPEDLERLVGEYLVQPPPVIDMSDDSDTDSSMYD